MSADVRPAAVHAGHETVTVFDLDGTITRHDTLLKYLQHALKRYPERRPPGAGVLRTLAGFAVDRDRGRLKSDLIRAVLGGLSRGDVAQLTKEYLDGTLAESVRHRALNAIERHRANGDHLVLLSASTDIYVRAIGTRLGFDDVICTELEWNGDRLTGALSSPNIRGAEKARVLRQLRAESPAARITAYANAGSDLEHLALADNGVLVNGTLWTRLRAARCGISRVSWA